MTRLQNLHNDLKGRQAIASALLDAAPERNVQICTPLHKQTIYASYGAPTIFSLGHVANGGFEGSEVRTSWESYDGGYIIDSTGSNDRLQSLKVTDGAGNFSSCSFFVIVQFLLNRFT